MPQTSYSVGARRVGHVQSLADATIRAYGHNVADSIPFGTFVVEDTSVGDGYAQLPAASPEDFPAGVAIYDPTVPIVPGGTTAYYQRYDEMNVLTEGDVAVLVEENVDPGKPVRVQIEAEAGFAVGTWRTTASAGKTYLMTGCRWLTTAVADAVAVVAVSDLAHTAD